MRVAVFEDNEHLRDALKVPLDTAEGFGCTGIYPNCSGMLDLLKAQPCDVALMDIEMPGINGIDVTRLIKAHFPNLHVLIQTAFFDDTYIFNAICAVASGYILKTTSPTGCLEALNEVEAGGSPMTSGIARRVLKLFRTNISSSVSHKDSHLTPREMGMLQMLVNGNSYKMIAAEFAVSLDTLKTHIKNIYVKLGQFRNRSCIEGHSQQYSLIG